MITRAEVAKLGALHAVEPTMLSLYLDVPRRPADLPVLLARAGELIAAAEVAAGRAVEDQVRASVREKLAACARDWPGRTLALFASPGSGLLEVIALPRAQPERAVLGTRPHIRPLLAALESGPDAGRAAALTGPAAARPAARPAVARPVVTGLADCLAAVSAGAVTALTVPRDGLVPGYECGRCGSLSLDPDSCPDWGTASLPVPDVIEEMVSRVLEDGGEVVVTWDGPPRLAARLSGPLPR